MFQLGRRPRWLFFALAGLALVQSQGASFDCTSHRVAATRDVRADKHERYVAQDPEKQTDHCQDSNEDRAPFSPCPLQTYTACPHCSDYKGQTYYVQGRNKRESARYDSPKDAQDGKHQIDLSTSKPRMGEGQDQRVATGLTESYRISQTGLAERAYLHGNLQTVSHGCRI